MSELAESMNTIPSLLIGTLEISLFFYLSWPYKSPLLQDETIELTDLSFFVCLAHDQRAMCSALYRPKQTAVGI